MAGVSGCREQYKRKLMIVCTQPQVNSYLCIDCVLRVTHFRPLGSEFKISKKSCPPFNSERKLMMFCWAVVFIVPSWWGNNIFNYNVKELVNVIFEFCILGTMH